MQSLLIKIKFIWEVAIQEKQLMKGMEKIEGGKYYKSLLIRLQTIITLLTSWF
jgi:hypothetical protein